VNRSMTAFIVHQHRNHITNLLKRSSESISSSGGDYAYVYAKMLAERYGEYEFFKWVKRWYNYK